VTEAPVCVWRLEAALGEGPVWIDGALWFVDIKAHQVHRFVPSTGERRSWLAPAQVGFVLPASDGKFIAGLQGGLSLFDPGSAKFTSLCPVEQDLPNNRLNDAVVDSEGRLWFGTMDDGEQAQSGAFYRYARGAVEPAGVGRIAITNGPAVSPDGQRMYWVDTLAGTISACALRPDGALGESSVLITIPAEEGHPDGPSIDSEGCLWVGLYGGWEARRYSPMGELLKRVRFPVANITKLAFGGPDLRTAFATSARQHLSPAEIVQQPDAGGLFQFDVDVPGVPCPVITA